MKIKNLFLLAALGLMASATLTSCGDILGHWEKPSPNPITPTVDDVIKYGFKVTDLAGVDRTEAVTSLKMSTDDGPIAEAEVSGGKITIKAEKLSGITSAIDFWFEAEIGGKPYIAKVNINPTELSPETDKTLEMATIGDVILSDGSFATKGTAEEQAVLAYIGKVDNYFDWFLAIALDNTGSTTEKWTTILGQVGTYAANHTITIGGTAYNTSTTGDTYYDQVAANESTSSATATAAQQGWRLPCVTDWRYILAGLGQLATPTPTDPAGVSNNMAYGDGSTLLSAINTACANDRILSYNYWSSSEFSSGYAWAYDFVNGQFGYGEKAYSRRGRAVFAY